MQVTKTMAWGTQVDHIDEGFLLPLTDFLGKPGLERPIKARYSKLFATPTMFTRLRNTIIQGGIFVQTSVPPTLEGFKILHANIATGVSMIPANILTHPNAIQISVWPS
ncbi:hypothetical protein BYT27DRAFT_7324508 [Phlegmacium glaucopus]|nr:hypothetical protein BYT27DRAFT_7324508 [Phlegmacium glaucopus]